MQQTLSARPQIHAREIKGKFNAHFESKVMETVHGKRTTLAQTAQLYGGSLFRRSIAQNPDLSSSGEMSPQIRVCSTLDETVLRHEHGEDVTVHSLNVSNQRDSALRRKSGGGGGSGSLLKNKGKSFAVTRSAPGEVGGVKGASVGRAELNDSGKFSFSLGGGGIPGDRQRSKSISIMSSRRGRQPAQALGIRRVKEPMALVEEQA